MSDEEEQHHLPTSVEEHEEEEKKKVSADTAHGHLDWKSYVLIPKDEDLRDRVIGCKSFQDIAEKLIKFLEANKEFRLAFFLSRQKHLHLINIKTFDRYQFRPLQSNTETTYFCCANYFTLECRNIIKIHHSLEFSPKNYYFDLIHNQACKDRSSE